EGAGVQACQETFHDELGAQVEPAHLADHLGTQVLLRRAHRVISPQRTRDTKKSWDLGRQPVPFRVRLPGWHHKIEKAPCQPTVEVSAGVGHRVGDGERAARGEVGRRRGGTSTKVARTTTAKAMCMTLKIQGSTS